MLKQIFSKLFVTPYSMPGDYRQIFIRELQRENLNKTKILTGLGVFFFFLLLITDVIRLHEGLYESDKKTIIFTILHLWIGLTIIPLYIFYKYEERIQNDIHFSRKLLTACIVIIVWSLINISIIGIYLRNSLSPFLVIILVINLILVLNPRKVLIIDVISFLMILGTILIFKREDSINMFLLIVESLAFALPAYFISVHQYNSRIKQFLSEKKVESNALIIEEALVDNFNKRVSQIHLSALRAQMNPHFLFNCLNSIKYVIVKNDTKTAAAYLTKFSNLIRMILTNSKEPIISLSTELEALKLYIEMEQFRFEHKFQYKIEIDDALSPEETWIPPMLLQPFVENAIWHGLMLQQQEGGILLIAFHKEEDYYRCTIEDNGIGRALAGQLKSLSSLKVLWYTNYLGSY